MARDFTAASNHVITAQTEDEWGTNDQISVFAVINPDSLSTFHTIVCKRAASVMTWQLRVGQTSGDATLFWTYMDSGTFVNFDNSATKFSISTGSWQYVGVTFDWANHTTSDQFKDGEKRTLTTTASVAGTPDDAGVPVTIGKRSNDSMQWDGGLAEIAIWSGKIPDDFMYAMTGEHLSPDHFKENLQYYYRLRGRQSPEPNMVSQNYGTVTGAAYLDHPHIIYPGQRYKIPIINSGTDVTISEGVFTVSVTLQSYTVTAIQNVTISQVVNTVNLVIPAYTVTAVQNATINQDVFSVNVTLQSYTVTAIQNVSISPDAQNIAITVQAPTITAVQNRTLSPDTQAISVTLQAYTVSAIQNVTINQDALSIAITLQSYTVSTGAAVTVNQAVLPIQIVIPEYSLSIRALDEWYDEAPNDPFADNDQDWCEAAPNDPFS